MPSLYERLGGEAAVIAAVDRFYEKVMNDELTRPFFAGLDMTQLVNKQVAFMTVAFGGPKEYQGRPLGEAHSKLVREKGLNDSHFDRVAVHLQDTLRELGVAEPLVQEAMGIVAGTRGQVLAGK